MMYLVLHDRGPLSGISIEPEGQHYKHRIACWALSDGDRVEFANLRMANYLKMYYMAGTYESRAMYSLPFDDLKLLLTKKLGLDDEQRYWLMHNAQDASHIEKRPATWFVVLMLGGEFFLKVTWGVFKLLAWVIAIPFFINFLKGRK